MKKFLIGLLVVAVMGVGVPVPSYATTATLLSAVTTTGAGTAVGVRSGIPKTFSVSIAGSARVDIQMGVDTTTYVTVFSCVADCLISLNQDDIRAANIRGNVITCSSCTVTVKMDF